MPDDKIFFTADWHFSHAHIIGYCNRPFKDVRDMDKALIRNYNEVVGVDDLCYVIGDVGWYRQPDEVAALARLIRKLNGTKILILGNHDNLKAQDYVEAGFQSVHTFLDIEGYCLSHDPATSIVLPDRQWLCGHVHGFFKHCKNVLNVGVDVWDYRPISLEEVKEYLKSME